MSLIKIPNQHIAAMQVDTYYHLGLDTTMPLNKMFGDVKFALFGGTPDRMLQIATNISQALFPLAVGTALTHLGSTTRYAIYKTGSVLCVSHGMGMPSIGILLHEVTKLLAAAKATDVKYIRVGTCGGLGLPPGSIVITKDALNSDLEPFYVESSIGKKFSRPSCTDAALSQALFDCRNEKENVVLANTMSVNCFYEAQGRLDGAICDFNLQEKLDFLQRLYDNGVRNIEMESCHFAAFCHHMKIPATVCCVTLIDRMKGDQLTMTPDEYHLWLDNIVNFVVRFLVKSLKSDQKSKL